MSDVEPQSSPSPQSSGGYNLLSGFFKLIGRAFKQKSDEATTVEAPSTAEVTSPLTSTTNKYDQSLVDIWKKLTSTEYPTTTNTLASTSGSSFHRTVDTEQSNILTSSTSKLVNALTSFTESLHSDSTLTHRYQVTTADGNYYTSTLPAPRPIVLISQHKHFAAPVITTAEPESSEHTVTVAMIIVAICLTIVIAAFLAFCVQRKRRKDERIQSVEHGEIKPAKVVQQYQQSEPQTAKEEPIAELSNQPSEEEGHKEEVSEPIAPLVSGPRELPTRSADQKKWYDSKAIPFMDISMDNLSSLDRV